MKSKPLNLYRRHVKDCSAHHRKGLRSTEGEERKRTWKQCRCPISASGTLKGEFGRRTTGKANWEDARTEADSWQQWDVDSPPPAPPKPPATNPGAGTIAHSIQAYLKEHESEGSARSTRDGHKTVLNKLQAHAEAQGYVLLDQLTADGITEFRNGWAIGESARKTYMRRLSAFFNFCISKKWITANPAVKVYTITNRHNASADEPERVPFSDAELERMLAACENCYDNKNNPPRKWTGEDLADFIHVSVYTGLRISDVRAFDAGRLQPDGGCYIRTTKTGKKVFIWIPEWLQERIKERARRHGSKIFGNTLSTTSQGRVRGWGDRLRALFALCGPWSERPTPHRFRDTTARILLQKGFTAADVAQVLGNSEKVVLKYYAAWVPERQARLTAMFQEAFASRPAPTKVVAIR